MIVMYSSVVVPTYNRYSSLKNTLIALVKQSIPADSYEIIVVDDCSVDDTSVLIEQVSNQTPNLRYIRHVENEGRVATRNDGIRAARGELVIFLDDDNVPDQSFVQAHIACHHAFRESHIAVMGNIRYATEAINQSNFAKYLQSRYLAFRSPSERGHIDYSNLPSRCLGTLNCSVRKSDLMAVGMFDTAFRYYGGEDEYLGYCLSRIGIRIVFCEEARTVHYDDLSLTRYKLKMTESAREGLPILLTKCPDYVESTKVRYLIPVDWKRDSLKRIASKLFIRSVLNPIVVSLLERFAILTDRISQLYCRSLYRLLVSGWIIGGQSSSKNGDKLVTYGNK